MISTSEVSCATRAKAASSRAANIRRRLMRADSSTRYDRKLISVCRSESLAVTDLGKLLVFFGGTIVIVGLVLVLIGRTNLPLGRLPVDIVYRGKNTVFYFPLATSILLSVVLSILLYVIGRIRR